MRQKFFRRKTLILPRLIHNLYRYRKFSEKEQGRVHLRNFSALRDRKFSTENLATPPHLSITFFAAGIFLKKSKEGFTCECFRHCDTKNFRRKILILLPAPSYSNISGTRNYCNNKQLPYEVFLHCETKNFPRKILILPPPFIQVFSVPEINATLRSSPTKIFGTVRQIFSDGKS